MVWNKPPIKQHLILWIKAKISSFGLLKFLSRINQQEQIYSSRENEYTRTHPLTKNRLVFINNHLKTSKYKDIKLPREYTLLHERMRAKLHGYILAPNQFKKIYLPNDVSVAATICPRNQLNAPT